MKESNSLKHRPQSADGRVLPQKKLTINQQHLNFGEDDNEENRAPLPLNSNGSLNGGHRRDAELMQYLEGYSPEMQEILSKILFLKVNHKVKQGKVDWSKQFSAASKKLNILKNVQNRLYIKQAIPSDRFQKQKDRIRKYMKDNGVDIMHLNAICSAFLDCDEEERSGQTTKKKLLIQIAELNLQFPPDFLFNLIQDIQENPNDQSEDAVLKYQNLRTIIEIYSNCPLFLKGDSNNSDNFKNNMDLNRDIESMTQEDKLEKLFRYVHTRIEEKFKGFRQAFRSFDKDFGGSINFKEFIQGMESIGVKLKLDDYRKMFEAVDYNNEGEIDFTKFCLLNTDRKIDLKELKVKAQLKNETNSAISSKKPPLAKLSITGQSNASSQSGAGNKLFGDGNIPKNKDINGFTKDIQAETPTEAFIKQRREQMHKQLGFVSVTDLPSAHSFGKQINNTHDMVAIIRNSYQEDISKMTMETLKNSLAQKKLKHQKITQSQLLRDKATKIKLLNLTKFNTLSGIPSSNSIPHTKKLQRSQTRNLVMVGNKFNLSYTDGFNNQQIRGGGEGEESNKNFRRNSLKHIVVGEQKL